MHTIETTVVMVIVLISLSLVITYTDNERSRAAGAFINSEAALNAARIEEVWQEDTDEKKITATAEELEKSVPKISSAEIDIKRGIGYYAVSSSGSFGQEVKEKINNPEEFMRQVTVIKNIFGEEKEDGE